MVMVDADVETEVFEGDEIDRLGGVVSEFPPPPPPPPGSVTVICTEADAVPPSNDTASTVTVFTPTCNPIEPVSHAVVPAATPEAPVDARQLMDLIPTG
jgi:hypothetical protein